MSEEKKPSNNVLNVLVAVIAGVIAFFVAYSITSSWKSGPEDAAYCETHQETPDPDCLICYPIPSEKDRSVDSDINMNRIKESYKPGFIYTQTVDVECVSRGTYKKWGITTAQDTHYYSRLSIDRRLISQEANEIVMEVSFGENMMVGLFTDIKEAKINFSPNFEKVINGLVMVSLAGGDIVTAKALTWTPVALEKINKALENKVAREAVGMLFSNENTKMFEQYGELRGKKFEITWRKGQGVVNVREVGCSINARERQYLYSLSIIPDVMMFPDFNKKEGETWIVEARDFVPFLDSSVNSKVTGSIELKRKEDIVTENDHKHAIIGISGGTLYLNEASQNKRNTKNQPFVKWIPKGDCEYDFNDGIFSNGELGGEMIVQRKGLNLFIFEMEHTEKPKFRIKFSSEVKSVE